MTLTAPAWVRDAVAATHRAEWSVEVIGASGVPIPIPVAAGALRSSADSYPRHTADIALSDMRLTPDSGDALLTPFGNRLRITYRLDDLAGNTYEVRPVPDLVIDTVEVERGEEVSLRVTASDPSLVIDTDAFLTPTNPAPDEDTVSTAVEYLIRRTFPSAVIVDTVNATKYVGAQYQHDGSPWACIESLADSVGAECYVRAPDGAFVFRPVPAVGSIRPPDVLAVGEGGTVGNSRSLLIRGYNRVGLSFRSATDADRTLIGGWTDLSSGPLNARGRYGRVTLVESRDLDRTQAEADAAAAAYARRSAGRVRDVTITATERPWLEVGDTVGVTLPGGSDDLVLTEIAHDLTGAPSVYRFRTDTLGPV